MSATASVVVAFRTVGVGKEMLRDTDVSEMVVVGRERRYYSRSLMTLPAKSEIPKTTQRLSVDNTIKDVWRMKSTDK